MPMRTDKKLDKFILKTLENSGMKGDELTKHLIIYKSFYKEVKPHLQRMTFENKAWLMSKFLIFVVQYETICARAFRPLSGSQSTARDIISMYSKKGREYPEAKKLQ
jgi:hypothetical protein